MCGACSQQSCGSRVPTKMGLINDFATTFRLGKAEFKSILQHTPRHLFRMVCWIGSCLLVLIMRELFWSEATQNLIDFTKAFAQVVWTKVILPFVSTILTLMVQIWWILMPNLGPLVLLWFTHKGYVDHLLHNQPVKWACQSYKDLKKIERHVYMLAVLWPLFFNPMHWLMDFLATVAQGILLVENEENIAGAGNGPLHMVAAFTVLSIKSWELAVKILSPLVPAEPPALNGILLPLVYTIGNLAVGHKLNDTDKGPLWQRTFLWALLLSRVELWPFWEFSMLACTLSLGTCLAI